MENLPSPGEDMISILEVDEIIRAFHHCPEIQHGVFRIGIRGQPPSILQADFTFTGGLACAG